jgi:competence protein ComEA
MYLFARLFVSFVLLSCSFMVAAEPLDINMATVDELDQVLIGVGKTKAEAIVQEREKNGKFKSVDDLTRVKGIGPATIEKNRDKITVAAEAPTPRSPPSAKPK